MRRTPLNAMSQLLPVIVWNTVLPLIVGASVNRYCTQNADCQTSTGQLCFRLYDGCSLGRCLCDLKFHRTDDRGRCVRLKSGGDRCSSDDRGDICRPGMYCAESICRCRTGRMSVDGEYCLQDSERLLGEGCNALTDTCLHYGRDGYSRNDINCSQRARCECSEGYKADGFSCRRWNIGEHGCRVSHQCSGGALCLDGRCACPPNYRTTTDGLKCAKSGAVLNLPFGAKCDEINETTYCGQGLVCHKCPLDVSFKCVKFLMSSEYAFLTSASTRDVIAGPSPLSLVLVLILLLNFLINRVTR